MSTHVSKCFLFIIPFNVNNFLTFLRQGLPMQASPTSSSQTFCLGLPNAEITEDGRNTDH